MPQAEETLDISDGTACKRSSRLWRTPRTASRLLNLAGSEVLERRRKSDWTEKPAAIRMWRGQGTLKRFY